jgi:GAF domain-containing protein
MARSTQQLKEEISRLTQEFSTLSTISQAINQSVDLYEILNNSLDKIQELTVVSSVGLFLLDDDQQGLVLTAQRGFSKTLTKGLKHMRLGEGVTGAVALSGEPLFLEDYPSFPEAIPVAIEEGVKSLIVIPLKSKTKVYGTLNLSWKDMHRRFSVQEKNLFNSIGQTISGALERAFLYSENLRRFEEQKT